MGHALPKELIETMDERFIYKALRDRYWGLPNYEKMQSVGYPDEFVEITRSETPSTINEIVSEAIIGGHDKWRFSPGVMNLFASGEYGDCLYAQGPSQLAGPQVYIIWARKFAQLFKPVGVDYDRAVDSTGYKSQLEWLYQIDFALQKLFRMAFLISRREYVEKHHLLDVGDLFRHVLSPQNAIMSLPETIISEQRERYSMSTMFDSIYGDIQGLAYPYTRQVFLVNGSVPPLAW